MMSILCHLNHSSDLVLCLKRVISLDNWLVMGALLSFRELNLNLA